MAVSVPAAADRIIVGGDPELTMTVEGIHGDRATARFVLRVVQLLLIARPGLLTMADLALPHH
ncbi:MAG TPA: hypothetical protein DEP84_02775 [Chloroflexi bacterium]|nr:hypothetical protein [Chloroflexota bacterium]